MFAHKLLPLLLAVLAGCTTVPPTNVHQPMSARPAPRGEMQANNGAIFQTGQGRPLFEDRRARYVGDIITVTITENTTASTKSNDNAARSNTQTASISALKGLPGSNLVGMNLNGSGSTAFTSKGDAANNNVFTGSMTATVIEVFPNGNLLISGEKQLAIGQEQEYVRFSGVVNPSFIDTTNTIASSRIADARIEYKAAGQINDSQVIGWLARFFLSVLPF
jgi:flagellar L-ring protein precursor FlgH